MYVRPLDLVGAKEIGYQDVRLCYYNGDVRRATFEDAKVVLKAVRVGAYTKDDLRVFLICSLVKEVDTISKLLYDNDMGLASLKTLTSEQREDKLADLYVPVGVRRKLEKALTMAAHEVTLAKLAGTNFKNKLPKKARFMKLAEKVVEAAREAEVAREAEAAAVAAAATAVAAAAAEAAAAEEAKKKRGRASRLLSCMSTGGSQKGTVISDESARQQSAHDADDATDMTNTVDELRTFLATLDETLAEHAEVLDSQDITRKLLESLPLDELEADLTESGLSIGARRTLILALREKAAEKNRMTRGLLSYVCSPKSATAKKKAKASASVDNTEKKATGGKTSSRGTASNDKKSSEQTKGTTKDETNGHT